MTPQELVQREVIYCVSCLISELAKVADQLDDYDEYMNLVGGKPDYEEAARYFILNDADLSDLSRSPTNTRGGMMAQRRRDRDGELLHP